MKAVEIMLIVPKAADDMMNVGRLNNFPGKLTAQGKLIKQGILLFCDLTQMLNSLDSSITNDILAQFNIKQQQQQQQQMGKLNSPQLTSVSLDPFGDILSTQTVGTSQMGDSARIVLNHLLSSPSTNGHQLKLRERQTFLFEQTMIFSEVARKSGSQSAASFGSYHSASNPSAYNSHPCYPHSHGPQGQTELCCLQSSDCSGGPQTSTPYCSRLLQTGSSNTTNPSNQGPNPTSAEQQQQQQQQSSSKLSTSKRPINQHHHHYQPLHPYGSYPSMPSYEYKTHLSINKMTLIDKHYGFEFSADRLGSLLGSSLDLESEACRFMLKSRDPNRGNVIYLLQTGCSFDRDDWVCKIRSMLDCQLDFLRALQSPIAYQRGLTEER